MNSPLKGEGIIKQNINEFSTAIVEEVFFSSINGYEGPDRDAISKLAVGQSYQVAEQIIVRIADGEEIKGRSKFITSEDYSRLATQYKSVYNWNSEQGLYERVPEGQSKVDLADLDFEDKTDRQLIHDGLARIKDVDGVTFGYPTLAYFKSHDITVVFYWDDFKKKDNFLGYNYLWGSKYKSKDFENYPVDPNLKFSKQIDGDFATDWWFAEIIKEIIADAKEKAEASELSEGTYPNIQEIVDFVKIHRKDKNLLELSKSKFGGEIHNMSGGHYVLTIRTGIGNVVGINNEYVIKYNLKGATLSTSDYDIFQDENGVNEDYETLLDIYDQRIELREEDHMREYQFLVKKYGKPHPIGADWAYKAFLVGKNLWIVENQDNDTWELIDRNLEIEGYETVIIKENEELKPIIEEVEKLEKIKIEESLPGTSSIPTRNYSWIEVEKIAFSAFQAGYDSNKGESTSFIRLSLFDKWYSSYMKGE